MNRLKMLAGGLFLWLSITFFSLLVYAQLTAPISDMDALAQIMAQFTSGKLMGLGLWSAIVQSLMYALRSQFVISKMGEAKAGMRLALLALLSVAGGWLILVSQGLTFGAAFTHSTSLLAYQVLFHQVWTVYLEQKVKAILAPKKA